MVLTLDIREQRTVFPTEKQVKWSYNSPSLCRPQYRERKPNQTLLIKETDLRFQRPRQPEFSKQSTREERTSQRENFKELLRLPLKYSAKYWSVHLYKETAHSWGKNHSKVLERRVQGSHGSENSVYSQKSVKKTAEFSGHCVEYWQYGINTRE